MIVRAAALDVGPLCVNHLVVVLALSVLRRVTAARARFCSGELLYVEDSKDNQRIDYIHLNGKLVAQRSRPIYTNTATVTYHHTDHIGSATIETNAYGSQTERTTRMPYGSPYDGLYREGPGYAGHVTDTQTNLTYMQQRYYDPVALRFLSPDPVDVSATTGGNFNRYWYANNNPYRFTDPDGRYIESAWDAASLAIGIVSLAGNVVDGNWSSAAVDAGGIALDAAALALPLVPGGAGVAIKASRAAGKVADDVVDANRTAVNFDAVRREAFDNAGMNDPMKVEFSKVDPSTGTVVEFKGPNGAKVGYDGPHASPGPHHDTQHISWQSGGKRGDGGAQRGNTPYSGDQHPSRPDRKDQK